MSAESDARERESIRQDLQNDDEEVRRNEIRRLIAERAKAKGVDTVAFDRAGFKYHGRIKALADSAREHGLKF